MSSAPVDKLNAFFCHGCRNINKSAVRGSEMMETNPVYETERWFFHISRLPLHRAALIHLHFQKSGRFCDWSFRNASIHKFSFGPSVQTSQPGPLTCIHLHLQSQCMQLSDCWSRSNQLFPVPCYIIPALFIIPVVHHLQHTYTRWESFYAHQPRNNMENLILFRGSRFS